MNQHFLFRLISTDSTTGTIPQVIVFRIYHQVEMAFRWRCRDWCRVPVLSRAAIVSDYVMAQASQSGGPFWLVDVVEEGLGARLYQHDDSLRATVFSYSPKL